MRATERFLFLLVNTENNINTLHGPLELPFILNALGWKHFYVGKQLTSGYLSPYFSPNRKWSTESPGWPAWRRQTILSGWLRFPAHLWKGLRADTSLPRPPRWCEFNSWALLRYPENCVPPLLPPTLVPKVYYCWVWTQPHPIQMWVVLHLF